ncbi:MAG: hypothetical protein AAF668_10840 [Pseudomonadota bacterium]
MAGKPVQSSEQKRRSQRNLAIAGSIVVFIVLIYFVTLTRIGSAAGAG